MDRKKEKKGRPCQEKEIEREQREKKNAHKFLKVGDRGLGRGWCCHSFKII